MFHCSLARQCLWSLPGEVLFKSLPQNARPVSPTGPLFCSKGGYITAIHWINYITDSCLRGTLLLSDKWAVWLICYYSKDLYSPSIHQSWLHHLMSLRSWRQQGVWTIQRFILSFFYFLLQKVILYSWILYCAVDIVSWHLLTDMVVMVTNINHYFKWGFILVNLLTWQAANMLT